MRILENKVGIVKIKPTDLNVVEQVKYIDLETGRFIYVYTFANGTTQTSHVHQPEENK